MSWTSEVLADNPAVWWRFDEAAGATAFPDSAPGEGENTGILVGNAYSGAPGLVSNDSGKSLQLMGENNGIVVASSLIANHAAFSASLLFKATSWGTNNPVLMAHDRDGQIDALRWRLYVDSTTGKVRMYYRTTGGANLIEFIFDGPALVVDRTYHLFLVYTGTHFWLYVDGSHHSNAVAVSSLNSPTTGYLEVGGIRGSWNSSVFNGLVDEFAYFPTAIADDRIAAHYAAATAPWAPNKTGSRLYFPANTAAPAGVTPAYDASWGVTAAAVRRYLIHKPNDDGSQGSTRTVSETSATPTKVLADQYISDPLPAAITISGRVMATTAARGTSSGGASTYLRMVIKVISSTGTVKAVLFTGQSSQAYGVNAPFHHRVVTGAITPFAAAAGDRIVVERGGDFTNTTTTSISIALGCHAQYNYPDAPPYETDGDITITHRPWIEFSQPDIWGPPKPTLGGEQTNVAEKPDRTPTKLGGMQVNVGEKPARTPTKLAGIHVNALVPLVGQKPRGLYTVGFPETEPRVLLPDGRWVPFRLVEMPDKPRPTVRGADYSYILSGRQVALTQIPEPGDILFLTTATKHETPKRITGPPTGLDGVTWVEAYRSLDDRYVAWFGYGATTTGTINIQAHGSETYRLSVVRVLKNIKPVLADVDTGRTLTAQPVAYSTYEGGSDQVQTLDVLAGSNNPDAVVTLSDHPNRGWTIHDLSQNVIATRLNPLEGVSPVVGSVSYGDGVSGAMYVIGGTAMEPEEEEPPFSRTVRYYPSTYGSDAIAPPVASSKWQQFDYRDNVGLIESIPAGAVANYGVTKATVPGTSRGGIQLMTPPLTAGLIMADFRSVWSVDYIGEAYFRMIFRLVSADGSVVRGELADVTSSINADSPTFTTAATNSLSGSLETLVAQRGDRILVEMGFHFSGGLGGSANIVQTIAASNGDLPFGNSVAHDTAKRPWIEFIPK